MKKISNCFQYINSIENRLSIGVYLLLVAVIILLFRLSLDYVYINFVTQYFKDDFLLISDNLLHIFESYVIAIVLGGILCYSLFFRPRASGIILVLYFIIVILPLLTLYGFAGAPSLFVYSTVLCFILLIFLSISLPRIKLPFLSSSFSYLGLLVIFGIILYNYAWLLSTGGLERISFDLKLIYSLRSEYVDSIGPFMGYLIPWQANIFSIIGLCYGLHKKNYYLLSLVIIAQIFLFGMTGFKSFLFAPLLAVGIYYIWTRKIAIFYIIIGAITVVLGSFFVYQVTQDVFIPSLIIRRLFFTASSLHVIYYNFFSLPDHPFFLLSNSIFSLIIDNPYDASMSQVIAVNVFGRNFNPCVGYLGDAYGNFGYPGMVFFTLLLGIICKLIDSVGSRYPMNFIAATLAMPSYALTQSALLTTFSTHGLFLLILSLWVLRAVLYPSPHRKPP